MFSIQEVAKRLDCSVQNIYNQQVELRQLGYLQDTGKGKEITEEGFNYLLQKRAKNSKVVVPVVEEKRNSSEIEIENKLLREQIELLKTQLQEANLREKNYNAREIYYQEQLKTSVEDKDIFKAMLFKAEEKAKQQQLLLETAENNKKRRRIL